MSQKVYPERPFEFRLSAEFIAKKIRKFFTVNFIEKKF